MDIYQCIEIAVGGLDGKPAAKEREMMRTTRPPVCQQCGVDMIEPAELCGFCEEENKQMDLNEGRADAGVEAVRAATTPPHTLFEVPIVTAIEDTLGYIAHACDRFGLHVPTMFRDALHAYQRQLASDGPRAEFLADGDHLTLSEVEHAAPATAVV